MKKKAKFDVRHLFLNVSILSIGTFVNNLIILKNVLKNNFTNIDNLFLLRLCVKKNLLKFTIFAYTFPKYEIIQHAM